MGVEVSGFASITDALERVPRRLRDSVARAGFLVQRELIESTKRMVNKSGHTTGALSGSWEVAFVSARPGSFTFGVFSDLPYAQIHDTGGIIKPVRAKALAVPVTAKARKMGPREWPDGMLHYVPVNRNPVVGLLALKGKRRMGKAQYLLLKQSKIKPTGYIKSAKEAAIPKVSEYLGNVLFDTVEGR